MEAERIGAWLPKVELFLRERASNNSKNTKSEWCVFFSNTPCNEQIMNMMRRNLFVICSDVLANLIRFIYRLYPQKKYWIRMQFGPNLVDANIWNNAGPQLSFAKEEMYKGRGFEEKLGIRDGAPIMCFHARDAAYLNSFDPEGDWSYHDYRDSNIKHYLGAATAIAKQGWVAVRMGSVVRDRLFEENDSISGIIDYSSSSYRSEFMDVYLSYKCRFFLCSDAGISVFPESFNKPMVYVNWVPLDRLSLWIPNAIVIPKRLWSKKEQRFLSLSECLNLTRQGAARSDFFIDNEIELFENTPEEISDAALEMKARIEGSWIEEKEDAELQERYWSFYDPMPYKSEHFRIGAKYLRQYIDWLH